MNVLIPRRQLVPLALETDEPVVIGRFGSEAGDVAVTSVCAGVGRRGSAWQACSVPYTGLWSVFEMAVGDFASAGRVDVARERARCPADSLAWLVVRVGHR